MAANKTKLELTWIGKDQRPKLEPRILLEDPDLSYHAEHRVSEDDRFDNILIHGDNLLALKALEAEYTGKVKCVYIDPPFNTGQAFEHYDDGTEHSVWLTLLRDRILILHSLLSDDGSFFVHIDDNELGYLLVLLDEIFGRKNKVAVVSFKQGAATGHKAINPGVVNTTNFVLLYAKNKNEWSPNRVFTEREGRDSRYNRFIQNPDEDYKDWQTVTLASAFAQYLGEPERGLKKRLGDDYEVKLIDFVHAHHRQVIRPARPDYNAVGQHVREAIDESRSRPGEIVFLEREKHSNMYFKNGERFLFYTDKLREIDGEMVAGEPLTSLWDDLLSNNLHNEGGVKFPKGKKPEALIKRCFELCTKPGDVVLDSFAGSGTTGAVAHKMGRRWIMAELGDHCTTHIVPRLRRVVSGVDSSGVTKSVNWKGGGGFRYYRLAPSLLEKDAWGNWIISREYNPEMLAEALCRHMGFSYAPSQELYWLHGHSSETDFIYVTTARLSHDRLKALSEEVGEDRTLLVCCKAFKGDAAAFPNLSLSKIPHAVLKRCEWGRDDYSLNVENLPQAPQDPQDPEQHSLKLSQGEDRDE